MGVFHVDFGDEPPACPSSEHSWVTEHIQYPSVVVLLIFLSLISTVFSLIAALKYNSVRVFNKNIRTPNISNNLWISYFATQALRGVSDAVRYSLNDKRESNYDTTFFLISLVLQGITALALCLALNHQRKFRSSVFHAPTPGAAATSQLPSKSPPPSERDTLVTNNSRSANWGTFTPDEWLYYALFGIFCIMIIIQAAFSHVAAVYGIFLAIYALQRLPIVILTTIIIGHSSGEGPTSSSLTWLALGAFLNLTNDIPIAVWSQILPSSCTFVVASWVDFVHLLYIFSLFFFFLFLRAEYLRNMEECIWSTVSQIQDTFDFRRFN